MAHDLDAAQRVQHVIERQEQARLHVEAAVLDPDDLVRALLAVTEVIGSAKLVLVVLMDAGIGEAARVPRIFGEVGRWLILTSDGALDGSQRQRVKLPRYRLDMLSSSRRRSPPQRAAAPLIALRDTGRGRDPLNAERSGCGGPAARGRCGKSLSLRLSSSFIFSRESCLLVLC